MKIHTYTGGCVQTNGYLLEAPGGWLTIDAPANIQEFARGHEIESSHLLLTHQHFDHVEDAHKYQNIHAYREFDRTLIRDKMFRDMGLPVNVPDFEVHAVIAEKMELAINGLEFELLHVPGHSPDSVAFYLKKDKILFGGDALLAGGIGRTDLPEGNHEQLMNSIREKLYSLPDDVTVYPGHGPTTTIGKEKTSNPFIKI